MCGEKLCGLHPGVGNLGVVMMLQKVDGWDVLESPAGSLIGNLQKDYQNDGGNREICFLETAMVASYLSGELGDVRYAELVILKGNIWAVLSGNADPKGRDDFFERHVIEMFEDEPGADPNSMTPGQDEYEDAPPRTAHQSVAWWLHARGFLACKNWPAAYQAHPELEPIRKIAIRWRWLDSNGGHPNHAPMLGAQSTETAATSARNRGRKRTGPQIDWEVVFRDYRKFKAPVNYRPTKKENCPNIFQAFYESRTDLASWTPEAAYQNTEAARKRIQRNK